MSHPRRRFSKVALSLCLTAVMAVGGSAGVASAHGFDAAEKPIDLGDPQLMIDGCGIAAYSEAATSGTGKN